MRRRLLGRDDYRDAKKFQEAEDKKVVGVQISGVEWLKSNGFITEEEYQKTLQHFAEQKKEASLRSRSCSNTGRGTKKKD